LKLQLTSVGNRLAVVLPEAMVSRLKLDTAHSVFGLETPSGLLLTTLEPEVERQVVVGRKFMSQFDDTFRELAK
jgi:antitoxin component of MazEF toxin-antitoxin module